MMPTSTISVKDKQDGKACSVCLLEFDLTSVVRKTPCDHIFHVECIDRWCLKNLSCPLCRTELNPSNII